MKCKFCKHYQIDGHRGGQCQRLGALMDGRQDSCPLAEAAFSPVGTALGLIEPPFGHTVQRLERSLAGLSH